MPGARVVLPADDATHTRAPWEWWYWTGHLRTATDRWFGFELVFFRRFHGSRPAQVTHAAITDIAGGRFHHGSDHRFAPRMPGHDGFRLDAGPWRAQGCDGQDLLHVEVDGWSLELRLRSTRPVVLHHDDGYTDYAVGGYTFYYSRPRMEAAGTLQRGGEHHDVAGAAWFDHQWGDLGTMVGAGWDWLGIQLDDGRDVMLFMMGASHGRRLVGATITDAQGRGRTLNAQDCALEPTGWWTSPSTGRCYPSGWHLRVEALRLEVTPVLLDQEVRAANMVYWEGAAVVTGDARGRAYVELTANQDCP